ncbi:MULTISPECIES: shikimate dehydrogenase [unclassified Marinobacterium]|uniref:shikimate dehydrogenase family protein n=1 Tax=unclassified Marinobacterium TaxID=2644139 RepID=UPI0015698EA7|nr:MULTISPECIES: shikimate dehydrogenase [unclassified Marinobacterium]NRP56806.1 Quinate/shikimate dehydrogenase [Marinobacterium sp. xm-d-510]NRP96405.1 Quinate/shikimate dehydrogenase [Marinobacterium sp. xm-a-127]
MKQLKLGLIGNSISQSRAPFLHKMLGDIYGFDVSYDLKDPGQSDKEAFKTMLQSLRNDGFTGCNVTFPFKSIAVEFVDEPDEAVREVGATNTLYLANGAVKATNTDYTGFIHGYKAQRGDKPAGEVLMLGAGGVGRAVAFGLFHCGATKLNIFDLNVEGAEALAAAVRAKGYNAEVISKEQLAETAKAANGLVNCTPVGHYATPGIPLDPELFGGQEWAFDAVYVPLETEFLTAAHEAGLDIVSGFDLFFHQGIDAFDTFAGIKADGHEALGRFIEEFDIQSTFIKLK